MDGGTAGAGGAVRDRPAEPAGFAELHFAADGWLRAVDLVEIEPVSGAGSARHIPVEPRGSDEIVALAAAGAGHS